MPQRLSKQEIESLFRELESASKNPASIIELVNRVKSRFGIDMIEINKRLNQEKRPDETVDQAFRRIFSRSA